MAGEPEALVEMRRVLGGQLAALRAAAGLNQAQLARATFRDRTSVAHIEKGRSRADERFWTLADDACKAEGVLLAGFHTWETARQDHEVAVREALLAEARATAQAMRVTLTSPPRGEADRPNERGAMAPSTTTSGSTSPQERTEPPRGYRLVGSQAHEPSDLSRALGRGNGDTGLAWGHRRILRCDAQGVPIREEIIMAAEESAQFQRWSATTNVDEAVLEQMTADVAELALSEQIDPPATTYTRLLGARDDVFRLIAGHQQPHHTTTLYKIASQITALLAMVTFDLDYPNAANTHARTALHCADMSGFTPIRVFIRFVQSNIAFSDGRYDEAAELMEAARPDATSGTTLLRLTSRMASINAARQRPDEVTRSLALAETASAERTPDEPGVLGFDPATAARNAGDAHYDLGGAEHLNAAVDWARIALDARSAETQPKPTYIANARFVLAHAYLGKGDLEAVGEHLASILHATGTEYRTVPVIGRARSLHTLLTQRTDLTSPTLTTLREDLAGFITRPAPTPPGLESGTT